MGEETTLDLIKHATCPVIAVVPRTTAPPTRVLVALDFSAASVEAAQFAAAIAAVGARFTLAYVPSLAYADQNEGETLIHQLGVASAFSMVASALGRNDLQVDHVVLNHVKPASPAAILLAYAEEMRCDLIAAGSARHSHMEQWLLGSVSTELVRDARHSMLVIARGSEPAA